MLWRDYTKEMLQNTAKLIKWHHDVTYFSTYARNTFATICNVTQNAEKKIKLGVEKHRMM